jgi:tetratricopeptide (TPR) repeat protein
VRLSLKWSLAAVGAAAATIGTAWIVRGRARQAAPAASQPCFELAPDPGVIAYKLAIAPAADSDLASEITGLERRIDDKTASPFDLGDLADAYYHRAQISGDPNDFDRSEALAKRSLEILPYPNGVAVVLAKLANAKHEFRDAIRIANEFLAHKQSPGARIVLASAHLALGELDQAIDAAERAVAQKPGSAAYAMRALVLQAQGRDAEAAFDFTRAVAVEMPGELQESARNRVLWGRFLMRRGELAGAGALFDEALRIIPDNPLALAHQGELALRTGKLADARAKLERAFAMSRQARYLIDLARAQELAGDAAGADSSRAQVEKLLRAELAERGTGHKLDLVEVLTDRGRPADLAEAVALGRDELDHRPSADTRIQLGRALYRSGARADASTQIHAALATGARDARLYELAARLDDGPRKALYAREAAKLDPGNSGWRALGMEPPRSKP